MNFIKRSWRGEEKLWKTFWIYGVVFSFVISILGVAMGAVISEKNIVVGSSIYSLMKFVYLVWIVVSLWRCAFNTKWKIGGYVARVIAVIYVILFVVGFILGMTDVSGDLIIAAECRKEMHDYAISQGLDPEQYVKDHSEEKVACYRRKNASPTMLSEPAPRGSHDAN